MPTPVTRTGSVRLPRFPRGRVSTFSRCMEHDVRAVLQPLATIGRSPTSTRTPPSGWRRGPWIDFVGLRRLSRGRPWRTMAREPRREGGGEAGNRRSCFSPANGLFWRGWDSNPRNESPRSAVFKTAAFDLSATPPAGQVYRRGETRAPDAASHGTRAPDAASHGPPAPRREACRLPHPGAPFGQPRRPVRLAPVEAGAGFCHTSPPP